MLWNTTEKKYGTPQQKYGIYGTSYKRSYTSDLANVLTLSLVILYDTQFTH